MSESDYARQAAQQNISGIFALGSSTIIKTPQQTKLKAAKEWLAAHRKEYVPFAISHPQGLSIVGIREVKK